MKYNTKLAAGIVVIVMLVSILFGGGHALAKKYAAVQEIFYSGVDGDGLSIYNEVEKRRNCGYNLLTIAERYPDADDAAGKALSEALEELSDADGIRETKEANECLTEAADRFYQALSRCELSETDRRLLEEEYTTLTSAARMISHDGYNAEAAAMNEVLRQFPTNLIAAVNKIKTLELY